MEGFPGKLREKHDDISYFVAHLRAFADEAVRGVAGDRTRPSVFTRSALATVKHFVTTLTWKASKNLRLIGKWGFWSSAFLLKV